MLRCKLLEEQRNKMLFTECKKSHDLFVSWNIYIAISSVWCVLWQKEEVRSSRLLRCLRTMSMQEAQWTCEQLGILLTLINIVVCQTYAAPLILFAELLQIRLGWTVGRRFFEFGIVDFLLRHSWQILLTVHKCILNKNITTSEYASITYTLK